MELGPHFAASVDVFAEQPFGGNPLGVLDGELLPEAGLLKLTRELALSETTFYYPPTTDDAGYVYAGPRAKRLTAEQFFDAVWQLTDSAPTRIDAQVIRGKLVSGTEVATPLIAKWIWAYADAEKSPAGEAFAFKVTWDLQAIPQQAVAVITCDNSFVFSINGVQVESGENWEQPQAVLITSRLKAGPNEILVVGRNGGSEPNLAGLFCELLATAADGQVLSLGTNETWTYSKTLPDANGKYKKPPTDWQWAAPTP